MSACYCPEISPSLRFGRPNDTLRTNSWHPEQAEYSDQAPTGMLIYIFIKCHPLDRYRIGTLSELVQIKTQRCSPETAGILFHLPTNNV